MFVGICDYRSSVGHGLINLTQTKPPYVAATALCQRVARQMPLTHQIQQSTSGYSKVCRSRIGIYEWLAHI